LPTLQDALVLQLGWNRAVLEKQFQPSLFIVRDVGLYRRGSIREWSASFNVRHISLCSGGGLLVDLG
jgi:hypothetical protein